MMRNRKEWRKIECKTGKEEIEIKYRNKQLSNKTNKWEKGGKKRMVIKEKDEERKENEQN